MLAAIIGRENIYRNVCPEPERIHENGFLGKTSIFAPTVVEPLKKFFLLSVIELRRFLYIRE